MTLEELDQALGKMGLDMTNPSDVEVRDMVLSLHGKHLLEAKMERCSHCWYRENSKCNSTCIMYNLPSDPVEASKHYLSRKNNIQIFPFMLMYMIPVYEKLTGKHDTINEIREEFKKQWKKQYGSSDKLDGFASRFSQFYPK